MHFAIGGDEFDVPSSVIISGDVFFLPASQQDALRFSLKPGDGRGELMVSAQAASGVCKAAAADSRNGACTEANTPVWSVDRLERRNLDRQGTQWEYVNLAPPHQSVASCYDPGTGEGRCLSFGRFRELVYSVRFPEHDIDHLDKIHVEIQDLLEAWRIKAKDEA